MEFKVVLFSVGVFFFFWGVAAFVFAALKSGNGKLKNYQMLLGGGINLVGVTALYFVSISNRIQSYTDYYMIFGELLALGTLICLMLGYRGCETSND